MPAESDSIPTDWIRERVEETLRAQRTFFAENDRALLLAFETVVEVLRAGGKLMILGNGGSAADAQHVAAELVNRYQKDRRGLAAIALTTDSSILTSIGNDTDFSESFARQIEALGKPEDMLLAISTSGNSPNVLKAIEQARRMGIPSLALTGGTGGKVKEMADHVLCVSSTPSTPRIQESFLVIEHLLCEWIEHRLFPETETAGRAAEPEGD